MECLILPVSVLRRRYSGYRPLPEDVYGGEEDPVTVVVGKEKREFLVEPFVLEENPFRVLIDMVSLREKNKGRRKVDDDLKRGRRGKRVIYVDVDAILFEHMLWLMYNDCSSLFQLNLKEIIDFYALDY
ncbi:hypothetical protein LguiA_034012 [Lonicera macranthoides]